jgi:hypothetical protein
MKATTSFKLSPLERREVISQEMQADSSTRLTQVRKIKTVRLVLFLLIYIVTNIRSILQHDSEFST